MNQRPQLTRHCTVSPSCSGINHFGLFCWSSLRSSLGYQLRDLTVLGSGDSVRRLPPAKRKIVLPRTSVVLASSPALNAMASTSISSSFGFGFRQCFQIAVVLCGVLFCLPTTTTALPMKDVIGQAMMAATLEQQQQQQHHLNKRAVTKTDCSPPANLEQMFQEINSKVS